MAAGALVLIGFGLWERRLGRRPVRGGHPGQRAECHGVAVARRLGSAPLLDSVQAAFVHGMDGMLWVCAAIAVAGMVLALVFLPGRAAAAATPPPEPARVGG